MNIFITTYDAIYRFLNQASGAAIVLFIIGVLSGAFSIYVVEIVKKFHRRRKIKLLLINEILYAHLDQIWLTLEHGYPHWKNKENFDLKNVKDFYLPFPKYRTITFESNISTIVDLLNVYEVEQIFAYYKYIFQFKDFSENKEWQGKEGFIIDYLHDNAYALAFGYGLVELMKGNKTSKKIVKESIEEMKKYDHKFESIEKTFKEYGFSGHAKGIRKLKQYHKK